MKNINFLFDYKEINAFEVQLKEAPSQKPIAFIMEDANFFDGKERNYFVYDEVCVSVL